MARALALMSFCLFVSAFAEAKVKPFLIGGVKADPAQWKAVVFIKTNIASGCLATVVGPRVIFTSAACSSSGSPATFQAGGKSFSAKITQSPLFFKEGHSLAIGVTNEDIPVDPISVSSSAPTVGAEVMLVGTGCTQAGPATDTSLYTAKTVISKLFTRFFDTSAGSGPLLCTEDRGGPALVQSGGVWTLLGVNAAVLADDEGNIKGPNSSARLDGTEHQDIIKKIANAAGVDVCGVTKNCGTVTPGEPSCQMTAAPPTVRQGEAVVITLKSENATKASIDGVDVSVPNGTRTLSPQKLGSQQALGTVTSAAGKGATCSASYTVIPKGDPGAVSCTLTATPSKVSLGETVTLEITASNAATAASINGRSVKVPSDKLLVAADKKGDFSAVGFVSGGGASANCYAEYRVEDGGVAPTIPNYGVVKTHCGADLNAGTTGISSVCLGTLKKDPSVNHIGFTQLVYVKYNSGVTELLPIVARRPVSGSSTQDELGLFANGIIAGNSGATMDMRLATLTKTSGGEPSAIEGATQSGKNFRSTLTPQ